MGAIYRKTGSLPRSGWDEPGTAIQVDVFAEIGKFRRLRVDVRRELTGQADFDDNDQVYSALRLIHEYTGEIMREMVENY